jgi:hypothetical protein
MSMREGLAQHERLPAALGPHYIDVDELTPAQLMTLALKYAGMVRFAEAGPRETWTHTWRDAFADDETLVMAQILALRMHRKRARFDAAIDLALASLAPGGTPVRRDQLPGFLIGGMVRRLHDWSSVLLERGSPVGIDLGALMAGVLDNLAPGLRGMQAVHDARPESDEQLDPGALLAELSAMLGPGIGLTADGAPRGDDLRALFRTWFNQLSKGIEMIQRGAAQRLQQSLGSGVHDPGAGLLLAFVQLYCAAQDKANRLTERHLDFYYGQVLRMRPRGPVGDTTFLVFEPGAPGSAVEVGPGAAFLAPFARQQPDLVYRTRDRLTIGDARLCALHTLFCERNPLTEPENKLWEIRHGHRKAYPTACRVASLPVPDAPEAVDKARVRASPLFGAPRTASASGPGQAARLGFALASNVLALREGERTVHVTLRLGAERAERGEGGPADTLGRRLALLAEQMRESPAEVGYKVLRRMFTLSLTGPDGWLPVTGYSAAFGPSQPEEPGELDALDVYFTLGADFPAVVPYDVIVHGSDGGAGSCPLLRFELNSEGYLYPYGLLRGLPLAKAQIDVSVRGHRSLVLQNQLGPLSAAAPFQPFGPLPASGSYLVVGSAEAASKRLTGAELVLEWGGLPRVAGGLRAYYAGYEDEPFDDVRCALSVMADGRWQPSEVQGPPQHVLFAGNPAGRHGRIAPIEVVDLAPLLHLQHPLPPAAVQAFAYSPGVTGGFFRLTLAESEFAFGHRDYPRQLAAVLTYNSQSRYLRRREALPPPNPPYTPVVETVSLNYTASATVQATPAPAGEAFLRLHPFGWEAARGGSEGGDLLLPPLDYSGNLYLGLSGERLRAPLTLYFHLVEDALPMAGRHARKISWAYLVDNKWQPLPPHAICADSTQGFLRPGIVTLALPADIDRTGTVMPAGLYWLRVSCEDDLNKFCQLYSVHPHAVQVWREEESAPAAAPPRIEAGTIRRPRHAIPGLGRITQMTASSGGRPAEDREQLRRRSAERLRHKGRAVTAEDYERLVLERFPEIDRVKCFPNLSLATPLGGASPGRVLVVPLPPFESQGHVSVLPRLNGDLIAQVHAFLAQRVAPGVALEVANPFYQRIQVRCTVRLAPGVDQGWYVNMLDRVVSDFISPWNPAGNTSPFGWIIRQHDIESFILAQQGVLGVSEFSMLSVSEAGSDRYTMTDTAVPDPKGRPAPDIEPLYPWSVAVPIRRHAILVADSEQSRVATRTGIGKLEIGSTFIISLETGNDEKK